MRRLLYVSIIHGEADMGSVGSTLAMMTAQLAGPRAWQLHQRVLDAFWRNVGQYLRTLDPARMRLYQDGLPVDGEPARRIALQAARLGSLNYALVEDLASRGARITRTEDPALLWQERQRLLDSTSATAPSGAAPSGGERPDAHARLLRERDAFIARSINDSLSADELGVLFVGAEHDVASLLASDIAVEMLKDRRKVRAYLRALALGGDLPALEKLGAYLSSPVRRTRSRKAT